MISQATQEKTETAPELTLSSAPQGLVQRKCGCSGSLGGGSCSECKDKKLQRYETNRTTLIGAGGYLERTLAASPSALPETSSRGSGHNFGLVSPFPGRRLQKKSLVSDASDRYEEEADRVAEQIVQAAGSSNPKSGEVSHSGAGLQRAAEDGAGSSDDAAAAPATEPAAAAAAPTTDPAAAETATGGGLIVEDETEELGAGQMRKTQFLDQLRSEVCAAADSELAAVGRSTAGCPYVERWIGHYRTETAQHVERALRRYAPDAVGVSSAAGYIPLVAARVRSAVTVWATTGQLTGVPEELAAELTGGGVLGALGGGVAAVASAAAGAFGGIGSAIGGLFTKAKEGGARATDDPQEIQSQLSSGQSLEGNVKSRMENAFGHDFSRVRVHSDSNAAGLSASVNARAFTIGRDVAFGAGEYQPNTLIGDALIAHELAHVVQQGSAAPGAGPQMQGGEYNGLEEDADRAAVSAVVSSWGGGKAGLAGVSDQAMPKLRSGLRLSRCGGGGKAEHACTTRATPATPVKSVKVRHSHLFGGKSSGTFATELGYANTVYAIAGISFASGTEETIDEPTTKAATLLGSNAMLAYAGPTSTAATYTAEENALMTHNTTAGEVTVYMVQGAEGRPDLKGRAYLDRNRLAVMASAPKRTLPHEMGHLLMGGFHASNNDNIMAQSSVATGVDCMSDEEIDAARANSLAT